MFKKLQRTISFLAIMTLIFLPILVFGQSGDVDPAKNKGLIPCNGPECTFTDLLRGIDGIIDFLIKISIPIAMILFAYAGFLYITAAGNSGKIGKAHDVFKDVIVGFLIVLSAWLIVNTIVSPLISSDYETLLEKTNNIEP